MRLYLIGPNVPLNATKNTILAGLKKSQTYMAFKNYEDASKFLSKKVEPKYPKQSPILIIEHHFSPYNDEGNIPKKILLDSDRLQAAIIYKASWKHISPKIKDVKIYSAPKAYIIVDPVGYAAGFFSLTAIGLSYFIWITLLNSGLLNNILSPVFFASSGMGLVAPVAMIASIFFLPFKYLYEYAFSRSEYMENRLWAGFDNLQIADIEKKLKSKEEKLFLKQLHEKLDEIVDLEFTNGFIDETQPDHATSKIHVLKFVKRKLKQLADERYAPTQKKIQSEIINELDERIKI